MTEINSIIEYCVKNPNDTVEDIMNKFNLEQVTAFYIIKEASKKL